MDNQIKQSVEKPPTRSSNLSKYQKLILIVLILLAAAVALFFLLDWWRETRESGSKPLTWEECIKLSGSRVLQTYPAKCIAPDGRTVTQP